MAKQLPFTNDQGVEFTESYWKITDISINIPDRAAIFTVRGYRDQVARAANLSAVGIRNYTITGTDFDEKYNYLLNNNVNIVALFYQVITAIKDVDTEEVDEDGKIIKKSFFEAAENV